MISLLLAFALAAAPAAAGDVRTVAGVSLPIGVPALAPPAPLAVPSLPVVPGARVGVSAPDGDLTLPAAALAKAVPDAQDRSAVAPLAERVAGIQRGVAAAVQGLAEPGADPRAVGAGLERLLTGEKTFTGSPEAPGPVAAPEAEPRDPAAAERTAGAVRSLAQAAEELISSRGLKASAMSGPRFADVAREAAAAQDAAAPADGAGKAVRAAAVRVVAALMPAGPTARESLPRLGTVLQVMAQELSARAAERGTVAAVVADAELFASQVEASVEPPAAAAAPAPAPAAVTPADPDGRAAQMAPGSVFGWQPIERSPDHGLPALDRLIRWALADKPSSYARGLELPGAARREDARVFFYGEKHTDGGLIAENMRRLVEDSRPGKPVLVLVEGYTGWEMRGAAALEYLAKRGLDRGALAAKGAGPVIVRGWDTIDRYQASKHPLLQHHMDLLELNRLAHSELRGARYYSAAAKAALQAWRSRRELWRKAIVERNLDLDEAVRRAAEDADASGATLHVIAGTDHLMESPRLDAFLRGAARPRFRSSLRAALTGRAFWASQPRNTLVRSEPSI